MVSSQCDDVGSSWNLSATHLSKTRMRICSWEHFHNVVPVLLDYATLHPNPSSLPEVRKVENYEYKSIWGPVDSGGLAQPREERRFVKSGYAD